MFARVSTFEGPIDKIDEGTEYAKINVLPRAREIDGWKGIVALVDRSTGKELTITLWESEDAMRASEEASNTLRSDAAEGAGQEIRGLERYEVVIFEV
jgi:heme-degrading monooxygenase HmoA